jgi:tetratricopeptide (TPR) repeat protein
MLLALVLASCAKRSRSSRQRGEVASASGVPVADASSVGSAVLGPRSPLPLPRTTSWGIAGSNLDAEIAERRRRRDVDGPGRLSLVELVLVRAQILANVVDLDLALSLAEEAVKQSPTSSDAHLALALAHGALHRFDEALKGLERARTLGAPSERIDAARASTLLATGRYDEALALVPAENAARRPAQLAMRAVVLGHMQRHDEAERLFEAARSSVVDVSPWPVAWMAFQHALALEAQGKTDAARRQLLEAVQVVPVYVHAVVHLAATDAPDVAVTRLEALRSSSTDPDVLAALAEAYRREQKNEPSQRLLLEARASYAARTAKHPAAYADHAARFYLVMGRDLGKALELAARNARLRPTEDAVDLWLATATAQGDRTSICAASTAMRQLVYASELRRRVAVTLAVGCPAASAAR